MASITTYKCRAECLGDFGKFLKALGSNIEAMSYKIELTLLNQEMTFRSTKTIKELVLIADGIEGCHILRGTLQPIEFYNGERVWEVDRDGEPHIDNGIFSPYYPFVKLIRKKFKIHYLVHPSADDADPSTWPRMELVRKKTRNGGVRYYGSWAHKNKKHNA